MYLGGFEELQKLYPPISIVSEWKYPVWLGKGAGTGGTLYKWPVGNGVQIQTTPFFKYPVKATGNASGTSPGGFTVGYKKSLSDGRSGTQWEVGPMVTEGPGMIVPELKNYVAADESALPYRGQRPMLRVADEGDYKVYRVPNRLPDRVLYVRVFKMTGERGMTQIAKDGKVAVWKGGPWRDGYTIHRVKKKDDWTTWAGFAIMLAVGGVFIMAATTVAAAQAAAASAAGAAGSTGGAAAAGTTAAGTTAGTTAAGAGTVKAATAGGGLLSKVGTAASTAVKAITGGGGAATAGGAATTAGTLTKLATTAYGAYSAIQQVQDAKAAADRAEKEAIALEKMNRDAEAAVQMQYAEQLRGRATALSLGGMNMTTLALLGGGAVLLVALLTTRRK